MFFLKHNFLAKSEISFSFDWDHPMYFFCAEFKGADNEHIYMSFYDCIFVVCNLMSAIKKPNISIMYWVIKCSSIFMHQSKLLSSITFSR